MLGWEFFVARYAAKAGIASQREVKSLASWRSSIGGTRWVKELVAAGVAQDLGGNGYPDTYAVPAGVLALLFEQGIPSHTGPAVFGENELVPGGWSGQARLDKASLRSLDPKELLLVEVWDQS